MGGREREREIERETEREGELIMKLYVPKCCSNSIKETNIVNQRQKS